MDRAPWAPIWATLKWHLGAMRIFHGARDLGRPLGTGAILPRRPSTWQNVLRANSGGCTIALPHRAPPRGPGDALGGVPGALGALGPAQGSASPLFTIVSLDNTRAVYGDVFVIAVEFRGCHFQHLSWMLGGCQHLYPDAVPGETSLIWTLV